MGFVWEIGEAQSQLRSSKTVDQRKGLDKINSLLSNIDEKSNISSDLEVSWSTLLKDVQNLLKKECETYKNSAAFKRRPTNNIDKNVERVMECFQAVTKITTKLENVKISSLINYIEGSLKDKDIRICKEQFFGVIKNILQDVKCLGNLEPNDFIVILTILQSEIEQALGNNDTMIITCILYLFQTGPRYGMSASYMREQFQFVSSLCQSISQRETRTQKELIIDTLLTFTKNVAEDNRLSCVKLGECVFSALYSAYFCCGHDSVLKVKILDFFHLQLVLHHPNGVTKDDPQSLVGNWSEWSSCLRQIYTLLTSEISDYHRQNVKNTYIFKGNNPVTILEDFVELFVEVCKQLFCDENSHQYGTTSNYDMHCHASKRRKDEASVECVIQEIESSKSWVWIHLMGCLLNSYPTLINHQQFLQLLEALHRLRYDLTDITTIGYIYACESVLLEIQPVVYDQHDNVDRKNCDNLWKLVGEAALRTVGLNQNPNESQTLLRQLIARQYVTPESLFKTYTSGVLTITEHHLETLEFVVNSTNLFHQCKQQLIGTLLNFQHIKNTECLLKDNYARLVVGLILKKWPELDLNNMKQATKKYDHIADLIKKSAFDPMNHTKQNIICLQKEHKKVYNTDRQAFTILLEHLQDLTEKCNASMYDSLCILGFLYNILGYMVDYQIIEEREIENSEIWKLILKVLDRECFLSFESYRTHSDTRTLNELLKIANLLSAIFTFENSVTILFKEALRIDFLKDLMNTLNYFQIVRSDRAEIEHNIKKSLVRAISRFCLVSNSMEILPNQNLIISALANPDYDFNDQSDYDLCVSFLDNVFLARPGFLPLNAVGKILRCINGLALVTNKEYEKAMAVIRILNSLFRHLNHVDDIKYKTRAVQLLYAFYKRSKHFGPEMDELILTGIRELIKVDADFKYSHWENKEVIKYVPEYLSSDFQRIRYRASDILTEFINTQLKSSSLNNKTRIEDTFQMMFRSNIKVFEVEGQLTDDRKFDEIYGRSSSALYGYLAIIIDCQEFIEICLVSILRLAHMKKLFEATPGLLRKVLALLHNQYSTKNLTEKYLSYVIEEWINLAYDVNDSKFELLGCDSKLDLYSKYLNICLPILWKYDQEHIFAAASRIGLSKRSVLHDNCVKIVSKALRDNIKTLTTNFWNSNEDLIKLTKEIGSLREIVQENVDEFILDLIQSVNDTKSFERSFDGGILFRHVREMDFDEFKNCLSSLQLYLGATTNLIKFLPNSEMQKIILKLQCQIYNTTLQEQKKTIYRYTVFLDLVLQNISETSEFSTFFIRDTFYFLINLLPNLKSDRLRYATVEYIQYLICKILPKNAECFEPVFGFVVNSLKNFAIEDQIPNRYIDILEFIIITNKGLFKNLIEKLDAFPSSILFSRIREAHNNIKYADKNVSIEEDIEAFLNNTDLVVRLDSLIHLKHLLNTEKTSIGELYRRLEESKGSSFETSLLQKLISTLIRISCFSNQEVSSAALKCLGELGPADLSTVIFESEKELLKPNCDPFELITGHVMSLLVHYIVDTDINVVGSASEALYEVLKYTAAENILNSQLDFGHGPIKKSYITPFLPSCPTIPGRIAIDAHILTELTNNSNIWCPTTKITHDEWLTQIVSALLDSFADTCYLKKLIPLCNLKIRFSETVLPLVINLMLGLKHSTIIKLLSKQINTFFTEHWKLSLEGAIDAIAVNKKSVKCMIDVVNIVRQSTNSLKLTDNFGLDYLMVAKAATFCSAFFSALLYAELWCRSKAENLTSNSNDNDCTVLDRICDEQPEEVVLVLQQILQNSYKSIGDVDALSGCGHSILVEKPEQRLEFYKNMGQWNNVMSYYSARALRFPNDLLESFKMNHLYQYPLSWETQEPQYECMWRVGQWDLTDNAPLMEKETVLDYEKYKFHSLRALCDNDIHAFTESKSILETCIVENLRNTSLESSRNLYPIFAKLQALVEMEDCVAALENDNFEEVFKKWQIQDSMIRSNDFQYIEPIIAQRVAILREIVKKQPNLRSTYVEMVLNFTDYAKKENEIPISHNFMINLEEICNLNQSVQNELNFRDAQLSWMRDDKLVAQKLLRKLCKTPDINNRLLANCLILQAEYMAEMSESRPTIIETYEKSIQILKNLEGQETDQDRCSLQDAYDKLGTFADKEYQQIMNHIKSDLFQRKVANIQACKEISTALSGMRERSIDEKRAYVLNQRQIAIDEQEIRTTYNDKEAVLILAIKYYIKNLSLCDNNDIRIFRIIALFLENRDVKNLEQTFKDMVFNLPSYKYITMLPQLIPHITTNRNDLYGCQINAIIEKCAKEHPHHTLPLILSLLHANKDKEFTNGKFSCSNDRISAAEAIIKKLRKLSSLGEIIEKMIQLSIALIELAYFEGTGKPGERQTLTVPRHLKIQTIRDFFNVAVPTCDIPINKTLVYNVDGIVKYVPKYKTVGGITAPKCIECLSTSGKKFCQLVKGKDDLRQDAVMQQVFKIMTSLLSGNKSTKNLLIRTYKIVPLSMRSGVLEWVDNSMPIGDYLAGSLNTNYVGAHKEFRPNDLTVRECREKYKSSQGRSTEARLRIFNSICKSFQPVFHKFFETHFQQPSIWYERRRSYTQSVATSSMCGYILGIGDRHVSNILIDKLTAEVIHIDFGIAFEQGKCLTTAELVPFRLTRDIVDGMGASGVEGLFRKSCEKTMEVLRGNSQTILAILEVLLYDPLYFWTVSTTEANKRQTEEDIQLSSEPEQEEENKNATAQRTLLRLKAKLFGTEEGKPTCVEHQVNHLIVQAMNPSNLSKMFVGWQPYL